MVSIKMYWAQAMIPYNVFCKGWYSVGSYISKGPYTQGAILRLKLGCVTTRQ